MPAFVKDNRLGDCAGVSGHTTKEGAVQKKRAGREKPVSLCHFLHILLSRSGVTHFSSPWEEQTSHPVHI